MLIGYARTSTTDQKAGLADQVAELTALGCEKVFEEHGSGVDSGRPELAAAIEFCRAGDVFVTTKPDRIARSAADLLATVRAVDAPLPTPEALSTRYPGGIRQPERTMPRGAMPEARP